VKGPPPAKTEPDEPDGPTVTGQDLNSPTVYGAVSGKYHTEPTTDSASTSGPTDEPTIANTGSATSGAIGSTDEPTVATGGHHDQPAADPTDEPTVANTGYFTTSSHNWPTDESTDEPTIANTGAVPTGPTDELTASLDSPTGYGSTTGSQLDQPTATNLDEPTVTMSRPDDDTTVHTDTDTTTDVGGNEATATGPTVGGWPADAPEPPPLGDLVWRVDQPKEPAATRSPAYYLTLGAAVVVVVGLIAAAAFFSVVRPTREVAGTAKPTQGIPEITVPTSATPSQPPATTPAGPLSALARHPLSASTTQMAPTTCALPRFDPADDKQAAFYLAAKKCAADAWRGVLTDLPGNVELVTVTAAKQTESCGEVAPTSAAVQCDGTVYMTPAHLRDTEQNGRYPGRYLGVFLREYAEALQFTTGLSPLVGDVTTGSAEDLDKRLAQQATCLAGVAAGAMSGLGAVDANITNEIRARLSEVDAPVDAKAWLDKGFAARQPAACNTWAG
jgi:hypothetical protein